jgi:NADH-quinone oxidoreductase subunit C
MSEKVLHRLKERFGDAILATHAHRGDDTAIVPRDRLLEIMQWLRDDPDMRFDFPTDMTVVDWMGWDRPHRFEAVYHLRSMTHHHRIRIKCDVPEEDPVLPSVTPLWSGLDWFEREAYDMYGVTFAGHPDLRRIFMYDEFVGHPLRKDYPKEKRQPLARRDGSS